MLKPHASRRNASGLTPIARVPDISVATITRFMDRGVKGIVAPHIESVDAAQRVISATYFAPLGNRSFGAGRPEYGQRIADRTAYMHACNSTASICLMIESRAGLEIAGELAALEGIDYLSFGLLDLAQDLGYPGQSDHLEVKAAVADATRRIARIGQAHARELHEVRAWINEVLVAGARKLLDS